MTPRAKSLARSATAGLLLSLTVFLVALGALRERAPDPPPLPVRFPEGALHGFLVLRSADGDDLAQGDLLVNVRGDSVDSRMTFRFPDGSRHDERVTFTQDSVFRMRRYELEQRGPAFPTDLAVWLDRVTGRYRVVARKAEGEREVHEDTLELPPDTYNGMVLTVAKNLLPGESREIHYVAFTPKPQVIGVELIPAATDSARYGPGAWAAVHFVVKPRLGLVRQAVATLLGRDPPDNHIWIVTQDVPGFVRFEGPLYPEGPMWRIELAAPEFGGTERDRRE